MSTTVGEYLASLSDDVIRRAYEGLAYNAEGDHVAAGRLQLAARLHGLQIEISGKTLGRHRSTRGLVRFRSRPKKGAIEEPAPAPIQGELLETVALVREDGAERAGWAAVGKLDRILEGQTLIEGLLREMKHLLAGMSGRIVIQSGKADALNAIESESLFLERLGRSAVKRFGAKKIDGIMFIRESSTLGLKEAKELYEQYSDQPVAAPSIGSDSIIGEPS